LKDNYINGLWLKCLTFANFSKIYDHMNTLLGLLPRLWKGPVQMRGPESWAY